MKSILFNTLTLLLTFAILLPGGFSQKISSTETGNKKGHLFIIGGGEKTDALMKDLLKISGSG
jgi:hypothetical protein